MRFNVALSAWLVLLSALAVSTARADDEEKISLKEVPKPVMKAVKAKFPGAKATEAEKSTEDDETVYEITLVQGEKTLSVSINEEGEIQEIEYELDAEKLPKPVIAAIRKAFPEAKIESAELEIEFEDGEAEEKYEVTLSTKDDGEVEVEVELIATLEVKPKEGEEKKAKAVEKPSKADMKKAKKDAKRDKAKKKTKTTDKEDDDDKGKEKDKNAKEGEKPGDDEPADDTQD